MIPGAPSYGQGRDKPGPRYTSLLHGEHLKNVTIRGDGAGSVLDGQGAYWWSKIKELPGTRGQSKQTLLATENLSRTLMDCSPPLGQSSSDLSGAVACCPLLLLTRPRI